MAAGTSFPSVFVSHGPPTLILSDDPVTAFLAGLGDGIGRPRSVLCVSAHWETEAPMVSAVAAPETIHDFYGFPAELYELGYPAPGAPELAARTVEVLAEAGLACGVSPDRGLDHGAWVPLMLMYPEADIPVAQLSIQHHLGPAAHLRLGRALAGLRAEGVLILGSGGAVHDLGQFRPGSADVPAWARRFEDWLVVAVAAGDADALAAYRTRTPEGARAHPRDEHFLPLLVAMGAAGEDMTGRALHRGFMDGAIGTAAFAFG